MRYFYSAKASKKDRDEGLECLTSYVLKEDTPDEIKKIIEKVLQGEEKNENK